MSSFSQQVASEEKSFEAGRAHMPAIEGTEGYVKAHLPSKYSILALCAPDQEATNQNTVAKLNYAASLADQLLRVSYSVNQNTVDLGPLMDAVRAHDAACGPISYVFCEPSYAQVDNAYINWATLRNRAVTDMRRAIPLVYANSEREYSELMKRMGDVRNARSTFDAPGAGGTWGIIGKHQDFERQLNLCQSFSMPVIEIDGNHYDPDAFIGKALKCMAEEVTFSEITELDRLRDEYFMKGIPVPKPDKFTKTKRSVRYSFNQLNTGSYGWAILEDAMLNALDGIAGDMATAGYEMQLNSIYRNPNRSSGLSQHRYGYAIDFQTFDFNRDGGADQHDWDLLRAITARHGPSYTEPVSQSGVGHVHVDWRGLTLGVSSSLTC